MHTSSKVSCLLLAMITLGCAEDGDDDGAVHERAQLAIEESCQHLQDCGSKNYGSARSCAFQVSMSYDQKYKKRDAACREAWIAERECFTQQSCEQLGESCDAEGEKRWNVCKDWEN